MNRILAGAAFTVVLIGSATAYAGTPTQTAIPVSTKPTTMHVDYGARCTSLAGQWKSAETAQSTNASLGKAKADAAKAETLCKSKKTSDLKKGASDYESALKLLGVPPT